MSTYSFDYISSKVYSKLPPITPKENGIIYSTDLCLQSSYNEEYCPKERDNQIRSFKPDIQYDTNKEAFNSQSSYDEDFIYNKVPKQKSLKPITKYSQPIELFETSTNYKEYFTTKSIDRCAPMRTIDSFRFSKSQDDSMRSHYQEQYVHVKGEKANSFRPDNSYKPTTQDEVATSNYQSEFVKQSITEKVPNKDYNMSGKNSDFMLFDPSELSQSYSTNYQDNFIKKKPGFEKVKNFKPSSDYKRPEEVFSSNTSYTSDFECLSVIPSQSYKPINVYQPPDEAMTSRSSYGEEFSKTVKSLKVQPIKPTNQITISNDPIDFVTDYTKEYKTNPQRLAGESSRPIKPTQNYDVSMEKFSGRSSYGDDFAAKNKVEGKES